jgi:molecular chaperone DnaK (HSP70)
MFEVKAAADETNFGRKKVDNLIFIYFAARFSKKFKSDI